MWSGRQEPTLKWFPAVISCKCNLFGCPPPACCLPRPLTTDRQPVGPTLAVSGPATRVINVLKSKLTSSFKWHDTGTGAAWRKSQRFPFSFCPFPVPEMRNSSPSRSLPNVIYANELMCAEIWIYQMGNRSYKLIALVYYKNKIYYLICSLIFVKEKRISYKKKHKSMLQFL